MSDRKNATGSRCSIGQSDNRSDYQAAFLNRTHRLLQLAYESLNSEDYQQSEEDDITGDLCKHMRHLTEIEPSERWMALYSVHDQDPSNDVISEKTGKARKGKRRPKIDIRLVCKQRVPNQGYCIEAKRLYRSDSVSEYCNDEGVGAFICGEYARDDNCGGMIGYVQSDSVEHWLTKIEAKLGKFPSLKRTKENKTWNHVSFAKGPVDSFVSAHLRNNGEQIRLFHAMFSFLS